MDTDKPKECQCQECVALNKKHEEKMKELYKKYRDGRFSGRCTHTRGTTH